MSASEDSTVLSSWKDIARYLGKGVRTVQRWERHLGLPVRRPVGASQKSAVVVYRRDVDAWLATRFSARARQKNEIVTSQTSRSARNSLKESMRAARELRIANHALTEQITASIRLLAERCDMLAAQSLHEFCRATDFGLDAEEITVRGPELLAAPLPAIDKVPSERIA